MPRYPCPSKSIKAKIIDYNCVKKSYQGHDEKKLHGLFGKQKVYL